MNTRITASFQRLTPDGGREVVQRAVAVEQPVAVTFNGIGYAVMMMTPADLQDFAVGFALSEQLVDQAADILSIEDHETAKGTVLRVQLAASCAERIMDRVRHRVSESSCGLCGIDNLESALKPLPPVTQRSQADNAAIFAALAALRSGQPLHRATGAVHAAALCSTEGAIRLVREDIGRHNAFDKLIGAMAREGLGWDGGFALLSARCSYELAEKAIRANCPLLVTISAPSSLALDSARAAGLELMVIARPDAVLAYQ